MPRVTDSRSAVRAPCPLALKRASNTESRHRDCRFKEEERRKKKVERRKKKEKKEERRKKKEERRKVRKR